MEQPETIVLLRAAAAGCLDSNWFGCYLMWHPNAILANLHLVKRLRLMTLLTAPSTEMLLDGEAIVTPVTIIETPDTTSIAKNI
jgi:hypothetical protein